MMAKRKYIRNQELTNLIEKIEEEIEYANLREGTEHWVETLKEAKVALEQLRYEL